MSRRSRGIVVAVVLIGFVALLIIGSGGEEPLDPDSTRPDGARGLVLLLEEFAAEVAVLGEPPDDDVDVAILLRHIWIEAGGIDDRGKLPVREGEFQTPISTPTPLGIFRASYQDR